MKKFALITSAFLLLIGVLMAGCIDIDTNGTIEYVDDLGDTVLVVKDPRRVITLTPGLTEMMFFLGVGDRIVGCDSGSDHPVEVSGIERVHTFLGPDNEKIVSLNPDIIFMDKGLDIYNSTYDALTALNLPVYRIYPTSVSDMLQNLLDIGAIMNMSDTAELKVSLLRERINAVEESAGAIPTEDAPMILHVNYYSTDSDPWVMTDTTISGDLIRKAGGNCVVSDTTKKAVQISVERILDDDPDIILTSQSSTWPTDSRGLITSEDKFSDVDAVKNGFVRDINGDIVDRGGPRMVDGLEEIHDLILEYAGSK